MELMFVRHGQTISNIKNVCDDNPEIKTKLTRKGERQAKKAAEILKDKKFDMIFTSEFFRTNETAGIINQYHNVKIKVDKRLDDRKTGFTGESERTFLKFLKDSRDFWNAKYRNGESFEEEKKRLVSFLKNLKKSVRENVLIVTHGEPMQIINGYFNKLNNNEMLKLKVKNCQIMRFDNKMVLRIAHRGASNYAPEDSLEAFRKAVELKLDAVEFDVHHTKDGKLVVMHDHNVKRTTDGFGLIHKLSLKELRKFHEPNGELVPTLQEVLDILKNKCICKIDIKDSNIVEKVLEMVKKNHIGNSVVITSGIVSVLKKTRKLAPSIKIEMGGFTEKTPIEKMIKKTKAMKAEIISPHYSIITKKLVDEAHKNGLEVHVWTVDEPKMIKKMKKLGVDGITSNYADKI